MNIGKSDQDRVIEIVAKGRKPTYRTQSFKTDLRMSPETWSVDKGAVRTVGSALLILAKKV
jgi:hypothetical protein